MGWGIEKVHEGGSHRKVSEMGQVKGEVGDTWQNHVNEAQVSFLHNPMLDKTLRYPEIKTNYLSFSKTAIKFWYHRHLVTSY